MVFELKCPHKPSQVGLAGLDGWDNVSCTGTNFIVRAGAAAEARVCVCVVRVPSVHCMPMCEPRCGCMRECDIAPGIADATRSLRNHTTRPPNICLL